MTATTSWQILRKLTESSELLMAIFAFATREKMGTLPRKFPIN